MTKNEMSTRHRGDLDGRLTDGRIPARVRLVIDAEVARHATMQHLLWMLANLLARQSTEIQEIVLDIPSGVSLAGRLGPLVPTDGDLLEAVRNGVARINPEVLCSGGILKTEVFVRIGPGHLAAADQAVVTTACKWCGYVGQLPTEVMDEGNNPIGAYIGASLCAGEIFKFVRGMRPDAGNYAHSLWLDGYRLRIAHNLHDFGPVLPAEIRLPDAVLVGVGAVGSALLHTLYALDRPLGRLTAIDGDAAGIEIQNLNRYMLFGLSDLTQQKAHAAGAIFSDHSLQVVPIDSIWQAWWNDRCATLQDPSLPLVLSAVDTNIARHAIQDAYPSLILGGSTNQMRTQINRYSLETGGPCLRCHNAMERLPSDTEIIARLSALPENKRQESARQHGIDPESLEEFLRDPHGQCGRISGDALQRFISDTEDGAWSVGFVSLLAGVLLAASYVRMGLDSRRSALTARHNMFWFQFWRPDAAIFNLRTNLPPQSTCRCQRM